MTPQTILSTFKYAEIADVTDEYVLIRIPLFPEESKPPFDPPEFSLQPPDPGAAETTFNDWFERDLWPWAWRKDDKFTARQRAKVKGSTPAIRAAIVKGAKAQYPSFMLREKEHRPHMATWISHERWNDPVGDVGTPEKPVKYFDISEITGSR